MKSKFYSFLFFFSICGKDDSKIVLSQQQENVKMIEKQEEYENLISKQQEFETRLENFRSKIILNENAIKKQKQEKKQNKQDLNQLVSELIENLRRKLGLGDSLIEQLESLDNNENISLEDEITIHNIINNQYTISDSEDGFTTPNKNKNTTFEEQITFQKITNNRDSAVFFETLNNPEIKKIINLFTKKKEIKKIIREQYSEMKKLKKLIKKDRSKIAYFRALIFVDNTEIDYINEKTNENKIKIEEIKILLEKKQI